MESLGGVESVGRVGGVDAGVVRSSLALVIEHLRVELVQVERLRGRSRQSRRLGVALQTELAPQVVQGQVFGHVRSVPPIDVVEKSSTSDLTLLEVLGFDFSEFLIPLLCNKVTVGTAVDEPEGGDRKPRYIFSLLYPLSRFLVF